MPAPVAVKPQPEYTAAQAEWLNELSACENPSQDPNIRILDVNDRYSYGDFMFQMATWLSYGERFGTTPDNINDPVLQRKVTAWVLAQGGWRNWYNCGRKVIAKLGYYPA